MLTRINSIELISQVSKLMASVSSIESIKFLRFGIAIVFAPSIGQALLLILAGNAIISIPFDHKISHLTSKSLCILARTNSTEVIEVSWYQGMECIKYLRFGIDIVSVSSIC